MFEIGDFVICNYYTGIPYVAKILAFKNDHSVCVELCCDPNVKKTFETEVVDVERSMLSKLDLSALETQPNTKT